MTNITPEEMIAWLESRLSYTCPITEIPVLTSEAAIPAIRAFIQKHSDPDTSRSTPTDEDLRAIAYDTNAEILAYCKSNIDDYWDGERSIIIILRALRKAVGR